MSISDYVNQYQATWNTGLLGQQIISAGCANSVTTLDDLLEEDADLEAKREAYRKHRVPVPQELTDRLIALEGEIKCAYLLQIQEEIKTREAEIQELRSRDEKKKESERRLAELRELRNQFGR